MRIQITNFRGAHKAAFDLKTITLIGGPNGGGKSSVGQAAAAVLSGQPIPYPKMPKNTAGALVTDGEKRGMAYVESDEGSHVTVTWPNCKVVAQGETVPSASAIAVGLDSPLDWTDKERAEFFSSLLGAEPDEAAITAAFKGILSAQEIKRLREAIAASGWDTVLATAREKGTKLKGAWEHATGEGYGPKKAENYYPTEWSADLESTTRDILTTAVDQAREWVDAGTVDTAVTVALTEKELAALVKLADEEPARKAAFDEATATLKDAKAALDAATERLQEAGRAVVSPGQDCPHCGKPLIVVHGKITPGDITQERADASVAREQEARSYRDKADEAHKAAYIARAKADTDWYAANEAAKKLAAMPAPSDAPAPDPADLETAKARLRKATDNLAAFDRKIEADGIQAKLVANEAVVRILAPDGLRLTALKAALDRANDRLADLCAYASWNPVALEQDLSITYGGRMYRLCSMSEQYRVRVALQMFIAQEQGASAVILDGADILTKAGRNGLFRMLKTVGIPALVCMSMEREAYDVAAAGTRKNGHAYWIENGEMAG